MADELWNSLQTQDRLIKLTIGTDESPPIYIQQKVLESVAPWFENALKRDTFVEGQTSSLSFPEDDTEAWKVLVCWIMTREIAIEVEGTKEERARNLLLCAKCWVLGDMYGIPVFQNQVMVILLRHFHQYYDCELPRQARNQMLKICPPDSKLAELLANVFVEDMETGRMDWSTLRLFDIGHIWSAFCKAQEDLLGNHQYITDEFRAPTFKQHRSGRFMVGDRVMAGIQKP